MNKTERIQAFTDAIWQWYAVHKRTLPWRDLTISDDTERAYQVMVSEIMLQQTQVSRVIIVFRNFVERFPTLRNLAEASNAEVIMAWRGMGYNSRALRLRDAAATIIHQFNGVFPQEYDQLLSIKGIGPYTAAAIRNFAFNLPTPCIDTNIRRILHRTFVGPENADGTWEMRDRELLKIAEEVLDVALGKIEERNMKQETNSNLEFRILNFCRGTADWHAALMDYGSLVQTKTSPKWNQCILTERGIMKTNPELFQKMLVTRNSQLTTPRPQLREPGRLVGSTYIPNRIFRGKIVEALRDAQNGLSADEIGAQICIDWEAKHRKWLDSLIQKLVQEKLLQEGLNGFILKN